MSLASAFLTFVQFFYNAFEGNRRISDHFIQFETKHQDYNRIGGGFPLLFSGIGEILQVKVFTNNKTEILI